MAAAAGSADAVADLLARLDRIAAAAAAAMAAETEGASLCSVSRSGQRVPGVKYPEGRWAAARELSRSLRSGAGVDAALAALQEQWAPGAAARRSPGGENWAAYRLGGADVLAEVAQVWGRAPQA